MAAKTVRQRIMADTVWPDLPFSEWRETCETLHMWTQIVGKVRLAQAPMINHWWQTPLYITSRGLTTSAMPYGERAFQIDFDFIDHELRIQFAFVPAKDNLRRHEQTGKFALHYRRRKKRWRLVTNFAARSNHLRS
jgi:hypothetical protein